MSQIKDPNNQDNNTTPPNTTGGLNTIGSPNAANQPRKPQGSGRFTNLQKYIQANQGASQRIAQNVGQTVKKDINKEAKESQDYYSKLRDSIQSAQNAASQGVGYQKDLQQINQNIQSAKLGDNATLNDYQNRAQSFGIQDFVKRPDFNQYQALREGRGINEDLLRVAQQRAAKETQDYLQAAQQAKQALSTEGGRFNLLRKTFGGQSRPDYSTGLQRLDQAILSQSGVSPIQADISQELQAAAERQRLAQRDRNIVEGLASQEQGIVENLNKLASQNEQEYLNMLDTYVNPINQQRQQEWTDLENAVNAYKQGYGTGFSGQQLSRLGITGPTRVFDTLENLQGVGQIAHQGRMAESGLDVATNEDVARYAALADMMGLNENERRLKEAVDLGAAWEANQSTEGGTVLQDLIKARQAAFEEAAKNTNFKPNLEALPEPSSYSGLPSFDTPIFSIPTIFQSTNASDILNQGRGAIKLPSTTDGGFNSIYQPQEQDVYNQFLDFLKQQNYNRTIGGDLKGTSDSLYGVSDFVDPSKTFKGK